MLKVRLYVHVHFYEMRVRHVCWIPKAAMFPDALTAMLGQGVGGEGEEVPRNRANPLSPGRDKRTAQVLLGWNEQMLFACPNCESRLVYTLVCTGSPWFVIEHATGTLRVRTQNGPRVSSAPAAPGHMALQQEFSNLVHIPTAREL